MQILCNYLQQQQLSYARCYTKTFHFFVSDEIDCYATSLCKTNRLDRHTKQAVRQAGREVLEVLDRKTKLRSNFKKQASYHKSRNEIERWGTTCLHIPTTQQFFLSIPTKFVKFANALFATCCGFN